MMNITFKYSITDEERVKIIELYQSFERLYIYQYPGWQEIIFSNNKICYLLGENDDKELVCYCIISEHYKIARVYFGPVGEDPNLIIEAITSIKKYYLSKHFGLLQVQLHCPTNQVTEYISHHLFAKHQFEQDYTNKNWSSLVLSLDAEIINIKRNFTKGHKYDVNRAAELVDVKPINTIEDISLLAAIYDTMYTKRKIPKNFQQITHTFVNISKFLSDNKLGIIFGIYLKNTTKLIGGLIVVKQGNTMLYNYGASDSHYRNIPILHKGIYEAICYAKEHGYKYFDFGGYNLQVDTKHQISSINRFKNGFGGKQEFYPNLLVFPLNKIFYFIFNLLFPVYIKIKVIFKL